MSTQRADGVSADAEERPVASRPQTPGGARAAARRGRKPPPRRRRRDPRGGSDLTARILVAIPLAAVALALVIAGGAVLAVGLFVVGALCLHELFAMYESARPVRLAAWIALAALLAAGSAGGPQQVLLTLVICIPLLFALTVMQAGSGMASFSITLVGIVWIGLGLAHAVMLRGLPHGEGVVIDVAVGTFLGDTGAYLGGRAFGRRRLAPTISPGKTVEGLAIGMATTVAVVWLASRYQEWLPGTHALVLGLAIAIVAPIGDLFESYVKREAGSKDSGGVFGAHGGALDRVDAVLFAAVAGYWVWLAYVH
jgi:phosphatidate cytidylyltransferase